MFASNKPTIYLGDAAAEEDYVLGGLGYASTKNIPLLTVIEDNNFSILTEKRLEEIGNIDVAKSFKMESYNLNGDPISMMKHSKNFFKKPCLLNINTNKSLARRSCKDSENTFDRYNEQKQLLGNQTLEIDKKVKNEIDILWKNQLEKQ